MRRLELVSDCGSCAGLCCELTAFEASEDFAFERQAGEGCRHLTAAHRCAIHAERKPLGMRGCTVFECYGAGPQATRMLKDEPLQVRIEGFRTLRTLAELAWLLREAQALCAEHKLPLRQALASEQARLQTLANEPAPKLLAADISAIEQHTHSLLRQLGESLGGRAAHSHEPEPALFTVYSR